VAENRRRSVGGYRAGIGAMKSWLLGVWWLSIGLVLLAGLLLALPALRPQQVVWGVTFSAPHARGIGLNWREAYDALLDDLQARQVRLIAYWPEIEPTEGTFDFSDLDYQMDRAAEAGAQVVLTVGRKVPRWPECHEPQWVKEMPEQVKQENILVMLRAVVNRYIKHPALRAWQLENEPLLDFGICPPEDRDFLAREELLLRELDPAHPILITDSGELNSWLGASKFGDLLGTTMYRTVFSERTQKHFYYDYIFPSWGYRLKARLVKLVRGKDVLISELQGEPWGAKPFFEMTSVERRAAFSPERFLELAAFARRTQLPEAYWWGSEYWYWEKETNNEPAFWEAARGLFNEGNPEE